MREVGESRPRVLFLGMQNELSYRAFTKLFEHNINICCVILSGSKGSPVVHREREAEVHEASSLIELPMLRRSSEESISYSAVRYDIPLVRIIGNDHDQIHQTLSNHQPDIACVVCFPFHLPADMFAETELGFLNLHPSLLPHHRGPFPQFWHFQSGGQFGGGVTVHLMDEGLDTGDIVLQQGVEFEAGISGLEADRIFGELGGELLAKAVRGLWSGALKPYPQPDGGSYDPVPKDADFRLNTGWPAKRAFNFMRGTSHWRRNYPVLVGEENLYLTEAVALSSTASSAVESEENESTVQVRFNPGILVART